MPGFTRQQVHKPGSSFSMYTTKLCTHACGNTSGIVPNVTHSPCSPWRVGSARAFLEAGEGAQGANHWGAHVSTGACAPRSHSVTNTEPGSSRRLHLRSRTGHRRPSAPGVGLPAGEGARGEPEDAALGREGRAERPEAAGERWARARARPPAPGLLTSRRSAPRLPTPSARGRTLPLPPRVLAFPPEGPRARAARETAGMAL